MVLIMELRVILHGPMDPRFNMAIDEAILIAVKETRRPTLRLYMWKPTGVSLGRRQRVEEAVNINRLMEKGYILVRRPTGGAALIHGEEKEITYSLVVPRDSTLYRLSIDESASLISSGIALALKKLGLNARIGGFSGFSEERNLCYLRVGASDITVDGRKISGSAQVRNSHGLLQHGTLLIGIDYNDWIEVIKTAFGKEELKSSITSLRRLGINADLEKIINAMINGFTEALNLKPFLSSISPRELEIAYKLYKFKYSSPKWNLEGRIEYKQMDFNNN